MARITLSRTPGMLVAAFVALTLLASACAPQAPASAPGTAPSGQAAPAAASTTPKTLTIAVRDEPSDLGSFTATSGIRGSTNATMIVQNALTAADEHDAIVPQIATELPSVEKGSWRVNADGSMDVTWKIRPNVKWQDGAPFTSDDLLFSFQVYKDPAITNKRGVGVGLMESATAPDPTTLQIHWASTYVNANRGDEVWPMPRHLLDDAYRSDKDAFVNSRYFTTEFIGLGPYRMTRWNTGSSIEFQRFDDYFGGRPPLDRVILKFVPDSNTMLANILSGDVDLVLPPNVDIDSLVDIQQRWQGTGNVARADSTGRFRLMDPQHRVEYARPTLFGTTNSAVRQALYTAIDRKTMADVLTHGIAPFADSWIPPDYAIRKDVESAIPSFSYDPARARQLLQSVGWTPGPDGVMVHPQTGEPFDIVVRLATSEGASAGKEKEANIIRDNWQQIGVRVSIEPIPPARAGDRQYESTVPGLSLTGNLTPERWFTERTYSKIIASDANRWAGGNKAGYNNPKVDTILESLQSTIDPTQRIGLHRQLLQEQMGDVAVLPLYWEYAPIFMLKGVSDSVVGVRMGYRFAEWTKA